MLTNVIKTITTTFYQTNKHKKNLKKRGFSCMPVSIFLHYEAIKDKNKPKYIEKVNELFSDRKTG